MVLIIMSNAESTLVFKRDRENHICALLNVCGVEFKFYPEWFDNEGEHWNFCCIVVAGHKDYDGLNGSRPQPSQIADMFDWFVQEGVIDSVPNNEIMMIVESIRDVATSTYPSCSASESYFGI